MKTNLHRASNLKSTITLFRSGSHYRESVKNSRFLQFIHNAFNNNYQFHHHHHHQLLQTGFLRLY